VSRQITLRDLNTTAGLSLAPPFRDRDDWPRWERELEARWSCNHCGAPSNARHRPLRCPVGCDGFMERT
jgi:hypothetical protein